MRYDAAIIGAGPDGLAAAVRLARAGLTVVVVDRAPEAGGRCTTREFHPGFRASPYSDEVAPIPAEIFWQLDLARRGALFLAPAEQVVLAPDGERLCFRAPSAVRETAAQRIVRALDAADAQAHAGPPGRSFFRRAGAPLLPSLDAWSERSLVDLLAGCEPAESAALLAQALAGRAADPYLRGSGLHLLGLRNSGAVAGGLAKLGMALAAAAREAGAELSLGLEAAELQLKNGRIAGVALADGTVLNAAAVISCLDLKRSILSLLPWTALPPPVLKRAANFRHGGGTARLLVALARMPDVADPRAVIHTASSAADFSGACASWRGGVVAEKPPAAICIVSAADPALAPAGKATATVTLGAIPYRLFDGGWSVEKRAQLQSRALAALQLALPGAEVLAVELIVPPDIEESLGLSHGDLDGGEIAADQIFASRAWPECPRTPIAGLYLAGPSSAVGASATAAAGWFAAAAVLTDHKAGRLR